MLKFYHIYIDQAKVCLWYVEHDLVEKYVISWINTYGSYLGTQVFIQVPVHGCRGTGEKSSSG